MSMLRARATRLASLALVAILAVALVACGDDDGNGNGDNGGDDTPVPRTPLQQDLPPTVEGNTVTSPAKGYAAQYPEGWEPRFNLLATPQQRVDAYFAPDDNPDEGVRANIALTCDRVEEGVTIDEYYENKKALITRLAGSEPPEPEEITVGGVPALRIEYNQAQAEGEDLRKVDTYLVSGTCGYNISLTAEQDDVATFIGGYESFIESFRLL